MADVTFSSRVLTIAETGARVKPMVFELRVATFGDSTADTGTVRSGSVTDQQVCDLPLTNPVTSVSLNTTKWQLSRFYPAARLVANGGIGGNTTTQMIAREAAASSTTRKSILDVCDLKPDVVLLRAGSINDIIAFTYPVTEPQLQGLVDRHMQIVDTFISNGIRVIDEGVAGFDGTNFANVRPALVEINTRISAACSANDTRAEYVRFLSPVGVTCDSNGAYLTGCSTDGTHLAYYGQYRLANAEAMVLASWFGQSINTPRYGVNLIGSQSQFASSSSAGGFGPVPTGFSWTVTQCTRQNATIEQKYGRRWATCEAVATGSSPSIQCSLPFGIESTASPQIPIVVGGQYSIEVTVFVESLDESPLLGRVTVYSRLDLNNASSERLVIDSTPGTNTGVAAYTESVFIQNVNFPIWQASESSATFAASSSWSINADFTQSQSIRFGISSPKIIKIN